MYKKILITSYIFALTYASLNQAFVAWSCQIESAPLPQLVQYMKSVDTKLEALKKEWSSTSNCSVPSGGLSASVDRTLSTVDRAFIELPIFDNTFLDFSYNMKLAINGETRAPVTRDGLLFNQIEKKITGALATATTTCNLSDSIKSQFIVLLQENQALENIFKQAALGTPASPTGLSEENVIIADAINTGYIPTATESCKDQNGTQDPIAKIQASIEKIGTTNESWLTDWKKAIAMFQGWSAKQSVAEKSAEQRKLLQAELARQGFSPRMAQTILGNFDCVKSKTQWDDSVEAAVRAKAACLSNPIRGLENITLLPQRKAVDAAPTTTDRVFEVSKLSAKETMLKDIVSTYTKLEAMKWPQIDTKSALMSNLIDIHLSLLSTAEIVEKRVPIMYKNCMKAQPGTACPKQ